MKLRSGQGLVEFALVLPILLLLTMGIFDFGRVLISYAMASNAVRDTLRQATIIGYYVEDPLATPPYRDCNLLRETVRRVFFVPIAPANLRISYLDQDTLTPITYTNTHGNVEPLDCAGEDAATFDDVLIENGDILEVSYTNNIRLITPLISAITPSLNMSFTGHRTLVKDIVLHGITDPSDPNRDTDFDGLPDLWEDRHFGNFDGYPDPSELFRFGAGDDPDNDGCPNGCEYVHKSDPIDPLERPRYEGQDIDTNAGRTSKDSDGDGLTDGQEAYRYVTDPTKRDTDGDCIPDNLEVDPAFFTPFGIEPTNPRDDDTDGDGLTDGQELGRCTVNLGGGAFTISPPTNPHLVDTDGDLTDDKTELTLGRDPRVANPPTVGIAAAVATEGSNVVFEVTLTNPVVNTLLDTSIHVDYATAGGTATAGSDFATSNGTLVFAPGETRKTIAVPTTSDTEVEGSETFTVNLSLNSQTIDDIESRVVITSSPATGTINDP